MKLKLEQILFAGLAVTMLFTACKKTETLSSVAGSKNAVTFSASISSASTGTTAAVSKIKTSAVTPSQTVPRAVNNTWEANDAIGVYMKQGNGLSQIVSGNKKYTTTGNGSFTAASTADAITFPVNGAPVDFISYYPYKSSLTNNIYPVDVSNQSSQGAIDLMYSNNAVNLDKTTPKASLVFTHQLSKLVFVVKNGGGVPNLTGLSASIDGLNTGGDFDLATGTLKVNGKTATIAAKITPEATDVLVEAIVPPAASITGATVTFTLPSGKFTWTVPANAVYEKGKKYTYQIELRNTAAIPVPVTLSATITDWVDVPSGSSVVEPDLRLKPPYKVAYYAFDHSGLPLSTFAPDANVVILFEGTIWAMADPANYPFEDNYIHSNKNYTSYEQIMQDIRVLQSKGVKVLYNVDDDESWQTTTALPTGGERGWKGSPLNAQQYIDMVTKCVKTLRLDGIALDVEHFSGATNDNFSSIVKGFGANFGPSSSNPSSIYTAAIYSGTSSGSTIGKDPKLAGYMNFVMDMSYSSDYTDTFHLWAPSIGNNLTMVGMQKGYVDLSTAIKAAQWQPTSGSKKAGIMVYAANDDPDYTSKVLKAAN